MKRALLSALFGIVITINGETVKLDSLTVDPNKAELNVSGTPEITVSAQSVTINTKPITLSGGQVTVCTPPVPATAPAATPTETTTATP